MVKTITIGDQSVELNSSAGWLYVYRENFGHDILPDIMPIIEAALGMLLKLMEGLQEDGQADEISFENFIKVMDEDLISEIIINLVGMEMTTFLNIFWAMAKNQSEGIEQPKEFFNKFETISFDKIIPEIFRMILNSSISSKNAGRLLGMTQRLKESSSALISSPLQESTEG